MLRVGGLTVAIAAVTAALLPLQCVSLLLRLPTRRSIPLLYHRILCRLLGVRVRMVGAPPRGPRLIAANHVSWLDIVVISAIAPVVFVAKREVGTWPVFGLLAKLQRSVFVDRERRQKTPAANREIAGRLAAGDLVVLFAEATSGDGNRVLPFRSSLIGAAAAAPAPPGPAGSMIQPLSIAYVALDGLPLCRAQRPLVAWYGAMDLLPHLGTLLRRGAVDAVVTWGEPLDCPPASGRKAATRELERWVRRATATALRASPAA